MPLRAAATALLLLLVPAPALAADRDRDRMPDRWERKHGLKTARGDADRDGLRNRDEYRARTNPRRRDSDRDGLRDGDEIRFGWHPRRRDTDRDGIRDGRENAGVVAAVDGLRVTIRRVRGGRLTGRLEDRRALTCMPATDVDAIAPGGDGDWLPEGAEQGEPAADEAISWDPAWGEQPTDLDSDVEDEAPLARAAQDDDEVVPGEDAPAAEDDGAEEAEAPASDECRAALRPGALVHEATSEIGAAGRRLTRLRLVD